MSRFWVLALILFTLAVLGHNWVYFNHYCFQTYDLGIYMEAVRKFSFADLNPFLVTFSTGFFNDHWHPALLLAKIPATVFPLSFSLFLTEASFCILTAAVPLLLVRRRLLDPGAGTVLAIFLLINHEVLESLIAFPVHPAVWANFPLLAASAMILWGSDWKVMGLVALSSFFGEQFSLSLVGLALGYLMIPSKRRIGFPLLIAALALSWFVFAGRALWFGPVLHQTQRVTFNPSEWVRRYPWDLSQAKVVFSFILEMLPLAILYRKYAGSHFDFKRNAKPLILIAGIFGPLILGRILSNSFGHQYSPLLICAITALMLVLFREAKIPARAVGWSLVAFFFLSFANFERAARVIAGTKLQSCVHVPAADFKKVNASRMADLNDAMKRIVDSSRVRPVTVLATGNLVPNLLESLQQGLVLDVASQVSNSFHQKSFDWIILEYGVCGDAWPWEEPQLEQFILPLESRYAPQILKKTPCLFLAQGPIGL